METQIGKFLLLILAVITFGCSEKGISSVNDTTSESAVIDLDEAPEEIELELGVYDDKDCSHWFGDTPCNMVLKDHNGEYWELYEHLGKPILLDFSTMWCAPCNSAAPALEQMSTDYGAYDLQVVTILVQDTQGNEPDAEDLVNWIEKHNIENSVVLQGVFDIIDYDGITGYPLGAWPTFAFITRDMILHYGIHGWSDELIRSYIEEII